jgi:hypothetical protein
MTTADPSLDTLWTQAAFASGWPTICGEFSDEKSLIRCLKQLCERLGELPQADVIEPYAEEPWELRVTLPDLAPERWLALVSEEGFSVLRLLPGCPTGARFALDCGALDFEEGPGLARRSFVGDDEYRRPLLRGRDPDEATRSLEQELVSAYRAVAPALYMESDRGMDTAEIVIEPCSGRFGLRLCFPVASLEVFEDPGPGREALFRGIEGVVRARASHPVLRLWPRIEWSTAGGLEVCLWMLGPQQPVYPAGRLNSSARGIPAQLERADRPIEVLLVPVDEGAHLPLAEAAGEMIHGSGLALTGGWPRWIRLEDGSHRFALSWWFPSEKLAEARGLVAWASGRADVLETRVQPQSPPSLEADWRQLDPVWFSGENRVAVISRELWSGRDRCPVLGARPPEPPELPLYQLSHSAFVGPPQPVLAVDERPGLLWRLSHDVWQQPKLDALLAVFDQLPAEQLGPVLDVGFDPEGAWLLAWR